MSVERKFDRELEVVVPVQPLAESVIYAHSTRIADFATPAIERVLQPGTELPEHVVRIQVRTGDTQTHAELHEAPHAPIGRLKHEIKRALHRNVPRIDLHDQFAMDMRFSFMGNYAHLIHDVLAPLRFIEQTLLKDGEITPTAIHVILPKAAPSLALSLLEFAGVPTLCTDGVVGAHLISITQELNLSHLPSLVHQPFVPSPAVVQERVFVSRRGLRSLLNEEEVTDYLRGEGFERVYTEDLSFADQWTLLANAREVVGIHGAGLSSLGFSSHRPRTEQPRFALTELFSPGFVTTCFRTYAAVLGGHWVGVRGKMTPEVIRDLDLLEKTRAHENASFEVDIESLSEAVRHSRSKVRS